MPLAYARRSVATLEATNPPVAGLQSIPAINSPGSTSRLAQSFASVSMRAISYTASKLADLGPVNGKPDAQLVCGDMSALLRARGCRLSPNCAAISISPTPGQRSRAPLGKGPESAPRGASALHRRSVTRGSLRSRLQDHLARDQHGERGSTRPSSAGSGVQSRRSARTARPCLVCTCGLGGIERSPIRRVLVSHEEVHASLW